MLLLLQLTFPFSPMIGLLPLVQIQLKCHLFSESLHPLLYPNYIFMCLYSLQNYRLLEGKRQLTHEKKKNAKSFRRYKEI